MVKLFENNLSCERPKQIKSNNILEAIIEVRYETPVPTQVLTWSLHNRIKEKYSTPETLPITGYPEGLRKLNPNFRNAILYRMSSMKDKYVVGLGDGIFNFSLPYFSYKKWEDFYSEFNEIFSKFKMLSIAPQKIIIRYINAFPENILSSLKLQICIGDEKILDEPIQLNWNARVYDDIVHITFTNDAEFKQIKATGEMKRNHGSVIDISVVKDMQKGQGLHCIEKYHQLLKTVFFELFTQEAINKKLQPCDERDL